MGRIYEAGRSKQTVHAMHANTGARPPTALAPRIQSCVSNLSAIGFTGQRAPHHEVHRVSPGNPRCAFSGFLHANGSTRRCVAGGLFSHAKFQTFRDRRRRSAKHYLSAHPAWTSDVTIHIHASLRVITTYSLPCLRFCPSLCFSARTMNSAPPGMLRATMLCPGLSCVYSMHF